VARLRPAAAELGLDPSAVLPDAVAEPLSIYATLLLSWGQRVNLTGAGSRETLVDEHLADALAILPHLPAGSFSAIDVGSGGGLPGAVLSILRPDSGWVLLEPIQKRWAFLNQVRREVGAAARLRCVRGRLEDHVRPPGGYDVAVSRAVWPAVDWLARARPLLSRSGCAIGLQTADPAPLPAGVRRCPYRLAGRERELLLLGS